MTEDIRLECLRLALGAAAGSRAIEVAKQYLDFVEGRPVAPSNTAASSQANLRYVANTANGAGY